MSYAILIFVLSSDLSIMTKELEKIQFICNNTVPTIPDLSKLSKPAPDPVTETAPKQKAVPPFSIRQ